MARTAETRRSWNGPAVLSAGFTGEVEASTTFAPIDWYVRDNPRLCVAVVAGFVFTAAPN